MSKKPLSYVFLILILSVFLLGCPLDNDGGSNSSVEEREFYIEDHQIMIAYYKCFNPLIDYPTDSGGGSDEILGPIKEDSRYILQPGRSYTLGLDHFNDHDNTTWIQFEIFVDGERYSSSGVIAVVKKYKHLGEKELGILLFHSVPWGFEGKIIVIDVWLEDEDGVKSEVYTFEASVHSLWYLTTNE